MHNRRWGHYGNIDFKVFRYTIQGELDRIIQKRQIEQTIISPRRSYHES